MIKKIFWLLLLVNIGLAGYLAFDYQEQRRQDEVVAKLPPAAAKLKLLAEVDEPPDSLELARQVNPAAGEVDFTGTETAPVEVPAKPVDAEPADTTVATTATNESAVPVDRGGAETDRETREGPAVVCEQLGPFSDRIVASEVAGVLASQGIAARIETLARSVVTGYWVILPPAENGEKADEMVKRLKAKGLDDVRRVYSGEMINAVSLGLYSRPRNADRRSKLVEKLGFFPQVVTKTEGNDEFWLSYRRSEEQQIPLEAIREDYGELDVRPDENCDRVAGGEPNP